MSNGFQELGISAPILQAIDEMGFETPTEVQSRAIPHILKQEDLIVMSKTGSGKTAVFGVSTLQLTDPSAPGPQALVLTPTRELAVQVDSDLKLLSKHLSHKTAVVYGQHSMNVEIRDLKSGPAIVSGTPGRVFDHIRHGNLITKNIRFLVLDEADRMLDMGFLDQVVRIIRTIPKNRVTLLFSATIPPEIRRICSEYMKNPEMIEIESQTKTVDAIEQVYYRVAHNEKNTQLNRLLLVEQPESCMIFCNTRMAVDRVQMFLTRKGYSSQALHGEIPQGRRMKTIEEFKQGEFHLLVATDVAARGIHIDNLSLVINYDVPVEKDSYVHRIGRTGRAGNVGRSITLVTSEDIMSLYAIEEHIGAMIAEGELPSEELFNERRAAAEGWLQANALKSPPPQESSGEGRKPERKRSQSGSGHPRRPERRTDQAAGPAGTQGADSRKRPEGSTRTGTQGTDVRKRPEGPSRTDRPKRVDGVNGTERQRNADGSYRTERSDRPGITDGMKREGAPQQGSRPQKPYQGEGRSNEQRRPYSRTQSNAGRSPEQGNHSGNVRTQYSGNRSDSSSSPNYRDRNRPAQSTPGSEAARAARPDAARTADAAKSRAINSTPAVHPKAESGNAQKEKSLLHRIWNKLLGKD